MSVVVKLTSKDKKVEYQSIGKEKKDPNPKDITVVITMWPVSQTLS